MDERISVGTSYSNGWFIAWIVLAALGVIGGLSLLAVSEEAALIVAILGLGFGIVAMCHGVLISRGRKWFTSADDGFTYEDRRGEFDLRDEDIIEIGTWARTRYSNGVPKSVVRDCLLVLSAGDFRGDLKFRYAFHVQKLDPLTEFLDRNLERLAGAAAEEIRKGEALVGEGWELDARELVVTGKQSDAFAVEELIAVDVVDNKVCVWVCGEPKPILGMPAQSINALVLLRVLARRFQERPAGPQDDSPGLGRIIFERDRSIATGVIVFCFILAGLLMIGGVAAVLLFKGGDATGGIIFGGILLLLGPAIAAGVWYNRVNVFRCHSRGVCRITTRSQKELEFKDVRVFSYTAIRQYVNGGYTGTTVTMRFEPGEDSNADEMTYSATMKKADMELDNLRDHVSSVIAGHMKRRLDEGKSVRWTDGLRFTPGGLEIELAGGRLSAGKSRLLAYEKCACNLHEGYFFLFKKGSQGSLYSVPVGVANFFPGFALLNQLLYLPRPAEDDEIPSIKPRESKS